MTSEGRFSRRTLLQTGGGAFAAAMVAPHLGWAQAPRRGGTLRISNGGDPPDYDVHQTATYLTYYMMAPCYSTLLRIDPDDFNKLIPDLAQRHEISADGRRVTFHLHRTAVFHNDQPCTSADVIYSLNRVRKPPPGIVSPRAGALNNIAELAAPDAHTVVITLKEPQADFLNLVANPYNVIYSKAVGEPLDASGQGFKRTVMGTGAFRLTQAVDGQIYELSRFDKYFGQPAHLDKIQFFPIRGEVERAVALQGKRIDASFYLTNDAVLNRVKGMPGITQVQRPVTAFVNLIPNVRQKPFDDVRVREAISLAIDRDAYIKTMTPLSGTAFFSMGLMEPGSQYSLTADEVKRFGGYDTLPGLGGDIGANRKRAMELLEQAGVPKGFKVSMPTRGDISVFRDSAINLAAQLKTIGLDANVDVRDPGVFYEMENKGDFQLVAHSIALSGSTVDQIFGECYTSTSGRNYGGWKDDAIDALFLKQSREGDPQKRKELLREFQLAFLKTFYHINLAWTGYGAAYTNAVKGWKVMPDLYANMQLDRVWLES